MKKKGIRILAAGIAAFTTHAFAYYPGEQTEPQLPPIDAYLASAPAKPPLSDRVGDQLSWLRGTYISGDFVYGFGSTGVSSDQAPGAVALFNLTNSSMSISSATGNIALGYTIRPHGGALSRVEIAYLFSLKNNYNLNPIYTDPNTINTSLNSSASTQALMLKFYWDINLDSPFIPYLFIAGGIANNTTDSSGAWNTPGLGGTPVSTNDSSVSVNKVAWGAGIGMRFKMNEHFFVNAGYEMDSLGSAIWQFNSNIGVAGAPSTTELSSNTMYVSSFKLGIALQY